VPPLIPPLGELIHQAGILPPRRLEDAFQRQRHGYLNGDFRRLGDLLTVYPGCTRAVVRQALARQGVTVVECVLCHTRYNALGFEGRGECLRCGRRLRATAPDAPLSIEDTICCVAGAEGSRLLRAHRQRAPRVGRYEILGEVGRGSMGVIYKAWEADLQRHVALKFLLDEAVSREDQERFRREARAIAQLRHDHIVKAHAIEATSSGQTYMVMDFVAGVSLETLALRSALSREHAVRIAAQMARALQAVHDHGLLHRDVKPANVVIDRDGKAWLVDFGIAKRTEGTDTFSLTQEGEVLGSLAYIAPEYLVKGAAALDARCDVYGVGVSLYESLAGGLLPYGDPDDEDLIMRIVRDQPAPVATQCRDLDPRLAKIVDRATSKDPAARHATAAKLAEELEAYLTPTAKAGPATRAEMDVLLARSAEVQAPRSRRASATGGQAPPAAPAPPSPPPSRAAAPSRLWPGIAGLLAAVALLLGVGGVLWSKREQAAAAQWRQRAAEEALRLGELHATADEVEPARQAFLRALEATPSGPQAERARAWLARLGPAGDD